MTEQAVVFKDVRITAGQRIILSLDRVAVESGQVLAVIGPNGAGKSTFLKACLGFQRPSSGEITVLGQRVNLCGGSALARLRGRIGYVPQDLAGRSELPLTLREVVAIGRTGRVGLFRPLRREDWTSVAAWIERLGLQRLETRPYGELSGGEQRKTLIARAMVQEPELLLLDEPASHLDPGWREQIVSTLQQLYEQARVTIVLVCHELEVLPPCCGALMVLEEGRMTACGAPENVLTTQRVTSLYGPGLIVLRCAGRHVLAPAGTKP